MKKRTVRRIHLAKETLRLLNPTQLDGPAGGLTATCVETVCTPTCKGHTCLGGGAGCTLNCP